MSEAKTMQRSSMELPVAALAAALAGTALVSTGAFTTGPALALVGFLMLVVEEDVRQLRIPNRLTVPALAACFLYALGTAGAPGLLASIAGATLGLVALWIPFLFRWLGAGDVKAIMVVGAFFGVSVLPAQLVAIVLVGGVLGLVSLLLDGVLVERGHALAAGLATGNAAPPEPGPGTSPRFPYGGAIAFGVAAERALEMTCAL